MTRPERIDETIQVTKHDLMRMLTDDEMKSRRKTRLQEMLEAELDQAQRAEKNNARAVASATRGEALRSAVATCFCLGACDVEPTSAGGRRGCRRLRWSRGRGRSHFRC